MTIYSADHSYDLRVRAGKKGESLLAHPEAPKPALRRDVGHSGEEVVVAAKGPGAERVRGFFPNTYLFHIMMAAYGWEPRSRPAYLHTPRFLWPAPLDFDRPIPGGS